MTVNRAPPRPNAAPSALDIPLHSPRPRAPTPATLLPPSPPPLPPSQVGFFDIVAIPLYSTLAKVFTGTKPLLVYLLRNYRYWVDQQQAAAAPGAAKA